MPRFAFIRAIRAVQIGRLRIGFTRTPDCSGPRYMLASWAYVTGYWRWFLDWTPPRSLRDALRLPAIHPSMKVGTAFSDGRRYGGWITLPLLGHFSFQTQPPFPEMKEPAPILWALHIIGPDDVHPAPSREAAEQAAAAFNAWWLTQWPRFPFTVPTPAVVREWHGPRAYHARLAARFEAEWLQPARTE